MEDHGREILSRVDGQTVIPPERATASTNEAIRADVWEPIETAPKDGTAILAAWPTGGGCFEFDEARWGINDSDEGWFDEDGGTWFDCEGNACNPPTHWVPLPQGSVAKDGR